MQQVQSAQLAQQADVSVALRLMEVQGHAAALVAKHLAQLRTDHALWYYEMEDADPDTAEADTLLQLLETAPTPWAAGYIGGKLDLRMALAAATGRF